MPATSKDELMTVTLDEYRRLRTLIDDLVGVITTNTDVDDLSIKDIIGHRAHWVSLFLGWFHDGRLGRDVYFPAQGYKWNELKRYNADLREKQAGLGWSEACAMLESNHEKLVRLISSMSETNLYDGPMKGAKNNWTVGRWAEAAGASHYRSARKYIARRLRNSADLNT
ncbi:ClbS/DfsB family four-helix bundle protein [Cochlodiniinecator piscidefendens]|uniref:ClbS/DfsB family four-helix bundle protein n=1 Tax=Cochlodiniinecator piscidefendens TaxID=2715756 RepID=UPI00140E350F|nr:ClbS/DfsB family four-helix bundle protein [Cochlodiniinecator piscidefendens]